MSQHFSKVYGSEGEFCLAHLRKMGNAEISDKALACAGSNAMERFFYKR